MKTFKSFLSAGIIALSLLTSCREADEALNLNETASMADAETAIAAEEPKDPPKDPPKDRDNWRMR